MQIGETLLARSREEWRRWLDTNHSSRPEIWLVFFKKSSGKTGIAYNEAVEEALCYGWIDGQMRSRDAETYAVRFTPRRARSQWSETNRALAGRLTAEGKMTEAGRRALPDDLRTG